MNHKLVIIFILFAFGYENAENKKPTNQTYTVEQLKQLERLSEEQENCDKTKNIEPKEIITDHCPIIWDELLCWSYTRPNTTAHQQCPSYVYGFNPNGIATKYCTMNGTWFFSESTKTFWTNYSQCKHKHKSHDNEFGNNLIEPHIVNLKVITQIGYSVSFATLLFAFFILTFVKRLRCPRNNLHLQLFASFMIRSFMFLIKNMFVYTTSTDASIMDKHSTLSFTGYEEQFTSAFIEDEIPTFSCKIFTTIWQYSLVANYNWILMEGLYLHNLIFFHIFNDNSSIMKYIILGWGLPILFIVPWVVMRTLYEDTLCWTTHKVVGLFWIIRGPITTTIVVIIKLHSIAQINFIFFLNITRVLFLKMFSTSVVNYGRQYRYRKWFKSTLVLVPLFGVHYMFFLIFSLTTMSYDIFEIIWLYTDLFFTSFQGCFVALLYCFCNGEVQQELRKLWQTWRSNHSSTSLHSHQSSHSTTHQSYLTQSLTYLSRGRNSLLSTCDNNIVTKKDINNCSRSPSPLLLQFPTAETLVLQMNDQNLSNDKNSVSPLVANENQNTSHTQNAVPNQSQSSTESIM